MNNFELIIDELDNLNLHHQLVSISKNFHKNKENVIDFFLILLRVFDTNQKILKNITYETIDNFFIEFLLYFTNINSIKIDTLLLDYLIISFHKLNIIFKSNILYSNLENKRFKICKN